MPKQTQILILLLFSIHVGYCQPQKKVGQPVNRKPVATVAKVKPILPGAYQTKEYVPQLLGKRVAVFANNTSKIGNTHLVDTLRQLGVNVTKIFGPEHGFRGTAGAGDYVDTYKDAATGIQVISLYGKKNKPSKEDLADVDVILFDIQDVGVRFYTYISSLQLLIESAVESKKPVVILDRPNPNGFYVDGPVLETEFKSFVGMQPVPIVYGMTIGEYAHYIVGEGLLTKEVMALMMLRMTDEALNSSDNSDGGLNVKVIKCRNYKHSDRYVLPNKPSPNLPDEGAVLWYPSTCLFEGTVISEGRGTDLPFQIFGHPSLPKNMFAFTPSANAGASNPKLMNQLCYGWNVTNVASAKILNQLQLNYLLEAYKLFPEKDKFFILPKKSSPSANEIFFNKLAGNAELMQQIKDGKTEAEIRTGWQPMLDIFKKKRKKYLLYEE